MDCQYQTLYYADNGYIVRCRGCGIYQVAYLCICITLAEDDYRSFFGIIHHKLEETGEEVPDYKKCITVKTPSEGIAFLFSKMEARQLAAMYEEADNEIKAQWLLQLFDEN